MTNIDVAFKASPKEVGNLPYLILPPKEVYLQETSPNEVEKPP